MKNVKFGKLEDFNKNPDAYVGVILAGITSKKDLLQNYADVLKFPGNFCSNWDYFDELLSDFHWITDKHHIVIYHQDIPEIGDKDISILLRILNNNEFSIFFPHKENLKQSFTVIFSEQYKERIEKILQEINEVDKSG